MGISDADYPINLCAVIGGRKKTLWTCPYYTAWANMMKRCYSAKYQADKPTYNGCSVDPVWHSFSAFRSWMLGQKWEGNHLDKDILQPGNKVYGPDSCVFISGKLNGFICDCGAARGEWPIGVRWDKGAGKLDSRCRNPFTGNREILGYFTDPDEAHEAWRRRKHEHACRYADMQEDPRIARALRIRYAEPVAASPTKHQTGKAA